MHTTLDAELVTSESPEMNLAKLEQIEEEPHPAVVTPGDGKG